ncbi:MAG: cytochrome c biogenesis protein CcsA [Planctomycetaceae bacterium]|nr:cytochrome c biogenesis protein CcsA [Planctomycetales bacterium]MCB9926933.1 cytochrome c biogenesis protein CcsA [Planctomycetaceae bacterium]
MTSNSLPATQSQARSRAEADTAWETVAAILAPIASLKLTVALFIMSIFLVFVGTLAQVDQDMWEIINNYFHSVLVWIPLQVFLPKTWFPNHQSVPGVLPFPGGLTLGTALFINLLAAHSVRFKPQATSTRLVIGLVVMLVGVLLTWAVIASGHNGEGLQGEPPISWASMWLCVKVGIAITAVGLAFGFVTTMKRTPDRSVEIAALAVSSVAAIGLALWLFVSGAYLGDSGMRILWQLIKCGAASVVLLVACLLIFKKRGGIVLIHGGIGLLMLGELFVGTFVSEERIAIDEGETVSHAIDIRSTELAITDSSGELDDVIVVPLWVKGRKSSFLRDGKTIQHEELPFDIEIVDYYRNSDLKDVGPDAENKATAGKGLETVALEVRGGSGADSSGEVDMSSAYIRFLEKGGSKDIGTYMLSQVVLRSRGGGLLNFDETVPVDGKDYHVELRFKRTYKPYSLRLIDVRKDDYIGTSTPRNYSSDVQLVDASRSVDREVRIWMNNPLRYAGETFYQSGYHADPSGVESTTLQVVKNTGWMIPYVSCVLVMFGMFAHFSGTLMRFLQRVIASPTSTAVNTEPWSATEALSAAQPAKKRKAPKRKRGDSVESEDPSEQRESFRPASNRAVIVFTAVVVLLFGGWLASKVRPAKVEPGAMDVVGFGKLPLVFEGRVKPFDTLARNSLRVMSTKEQLKDGTGNTQPAIVWLMDVISGAKAGTKHQVFKIDNLELLETLKLTRRKGGLYSLDEIEPRMEEFRKQVRLANEVPPEEMSVYQRKVLELDRKLQLFFKLREAFRMPEEGLPADEEASYLAGMANVSQELATAPVPYAIPTTGNAKQPWEPFVTAVTRLWAKDIAEKYKAKSTAELSERLSAEILNEDNINQMVETRLLGMIKSLADQSIPPDQLDAYARESLVRMPEDVRERVTGGLREEIAASGREIQTTLTMSLDTALGDGGLQGPENPVARSMWNMLSSYRDSDEHSFSRALNAYHAALATTAPESLNIGKTNFEAAFNHFAPFYNCAALYVFAFVLTTLSWLAWPFRWNRPFNWAAFGLIAVTFLVHTLALVGRIYISGRPPVTNLYSSAIFIGWAAVILGLGLELLFRLGIGNIISAISGFSTLVIAHQLAGDGDTFTVLQAVLDTQFWLATHVVSITLGYATTFVAGLLGIVFVIAGIATPTLSEQVGQWTVRKVLANMIYGIVCFALLFSFVGTVLGGLWADDSWGRFWGWDPKENGALIIVLWNALVLHARWGGMVRDRGMALLAIGGNMVTAWSWFGVNELGVGLHSYGFTEGVVPTLTLFWGSQLAIIAVGLLPTSMWWSYKAEARQKTNKPLKAQLAT